MLVLVAGCQTTTNETAETAASRSQFRTEIPENLYDVAFANAMAQQIAIGCPTLSVDRSRIARSMKATADDLEAKGYRESDFKYLEENMPRKRIQDDAIRYIQERGIVVGVPETMCSAGRSEIAKSSTIGTFLKG
ncbi:DUF5333 family protein [uncultured Ruegeria sp.]|uniref:DUF5333 family protein n=1 Tax=uncultured Ruegeria sp. TaxID=259304 RepID=UPI00261E13DE|nr:DUF5333 family protein [uncultured Ruegeria sp.]